ncbi:MAG: response regulator [Actinobacteria bacterium]|nr:response regulator [Actinomycetota bacterium]
MAAKILVIEDEGDIVRALAIRLKSYGYEVVTASGGMEGLGTVKDEKPDLILLDLRMQDLDGFQFMEKHFEDKETGRIPVIVLSASAEEGTKSRAILSGAKYYVTKPFDHEYLKKCIEDALVSQ